MDMVHLMSFLLLTNKNVLHVYSAFSLDFRSRTRAYFIIKSTYNSYPRDLVYHFLAMVDRQFARAAGVGIGGGGGGEANGGIAIISAAPANKGDKRIESKSLTTLEREAKGTYQFSKGNVHFLLYISIQHTMLLSFTSP